METLNDKLTAEKMINRVNSLTPQTENKWGKMNVAQMLHHCSLALEMAVGERQFNYPFMMKVFGKLFIKKLILNKEDYKPNLPTGKDFLIRDERNFEKEKANVLSLIKKYTIVDAAYLKNKKHPLIGKLTREEWGWMQYKHLDHHLRQFGA